MSKRKPRKPKAASARSKTAPKASGEKKAGFGQLFARMLFLAGSVLTAFYTIYTVLEPDNGDTTNEWIAENLPALLTYEWVLYSVIAAGFIFAAFKWIFQLDRKRYDFAVFTLVFVAINFLFVLSFDKDIGSFGDNAQYIVHSKSLLEKGGPYNIYFINETYKARAPIGLPMMLAPITAIWGMDVVKMKGMVFLLGSLALVLYFLVFRKLTNRYLAALLTMLIGTFPLFIYNTSYVMTEVPFLFSLALAAFCALKFSEAKARNRIITWGALTVATAFFAYLTRAVGAAMIGAVCAWLFFRVPWRSIFKGETAWWSSEVKRFVAITVSLIVLFGAWQLQTSMLSKRNEAQMAAVQHVDLEVNDNDEADETETAPVEAKKRSSQLAQYLGSNFTERFSTNFKKVNRLWGQQIFNKDLSRWYLSLGKAAQIKDKTDGALRLFNFILLISLIAGLIRRDLLAFVLLFLILATLSGTGTPVIIVYSRYFIPFVPFMIYLIARLAVDVAAFIQERQKSESRALPGFAAFASTIFLYLMLYHNFSGNAYNTQRQNSGNAYTIAFDNYVLAGKWAKEHLEPDAIIASRKPRLFYVFSERKGVYTVTYSNMTYSAEVEADRLNFFREKGVDYIVMDAFSTASRKVVLPLIQNNPDKFQVVESVGEPYPSHIVRFVP